jgi:hypothetical protein
VLNRVLVPLPEQVDKIAWPINYHRKQVADVPTENTAPSHSQGGRG